MNLLQITFDTTINFTDILCTIGFPTVLIYLGRHRRAAKMRDIKQDAIIETLFYSANGREKDLRIYFDAQVKKGRENAKFIDGK